MNDPKFLRVETLFPAFQRAGCRIAVITAKDKLRGLLGKGLTLGAGKACSFSSEKSDKASLAENGIEKVNALVGMAVPDVYSAGLSEFVFAAGVKLMERDRPEIMYLSTTDYIQHKHAPGTPVANDFYAMMDGYMAKLDAMGCTIVLTADHGMNAKFGADGQPDVIYLQDVFDGWLGPTRRASSCPSPIPMSCITARSAPSPWSTCRPARRPRRWPPGSRPCPASRRRFPRRRPRNASSCRPIGWAIWSSSRPSTRCWAPRRRATISRASPSRCAAMAASPSRRCRCSAIASSPRHGVASLAQLRRLRSRPQPRRLREPSMDTLTRPTPDVRHEMLRIAGKKVETRPAWKSASPGTTAWSAPCRAPRRAGGRGFQDRPRLQAQAHALPAPADPAQDGRAFGRPQGGAEPPDHARIGALPERLRCTRLAAPSTSSPLPASSACSTTARPSPAISPRTASRARSSPCASRSMPSRPSRPSTIRSTWWRTSWRRPSPPTTAWC